MACVFFSSIGTYRTCWAASLTLLPQVQPSQREVILSCMAKRTIRWQEQTSDIHRPVIDLYDCVPLVWNMHLPCHPECPGWAYPYPECGHQDWQRHWWRWPGSQLPRVHSVKGGTNKAFFVSLRYQQRELNVWDCSEKTSWHLFPFSHYRNLCCLNMASVGWLSLWLRR